MGTYFFIKGELINHSRKVYTMQKLMGDFGGFIGLILKGITVISYQGSYVFVIYQFIQKLYFSKKLNTTKNG